jgi:hypothetical protein
LVGGVAADDMADLVREDAGQLRFVIGGKE